jgi:glycerol-3-phosphate dehydrogenase (NAD(P)+)
MTEEKMRVSVLGSGSWGTALANLAAGRGHRVMMWAFEPDVVEGINNRHQNPLYMKELALPPNVRATGDIRAAVHDAEMVLVVIPAQHLRENVVAVRNDLPAEIPLVVCSKGIERKSLATMEQILTAELPGKNHAGIAVLSGPSFAYEVSRHSPTNVTVAARERATAQRVQQALATRSFRVYTTDDVIGVELGGALKNVLAIAVGAADGLGLGHNTRAGLITRGLAEISRLAVNMGGRPETMLGLAGVGDLILTCTSDLSRNYQVGRLLAQGRTIKEIQESMRMVAEGVPTAESVYHLAQTRGVEMPISEQVFRVLYQGLAVVDAMRALQDRTLKEEWRP